MEAPADDEFEVSLFGPGVGECIAIHVGDNDWIVVDSCLDPATRRPAALQYLERLGIDAAECVKLLVVSHWHDDHIRGAAEILNTCPAAEFACSAALTTREFFDAWALWSTEGTGVSEITRVFEHLRNRRARRDQRFAGPDHHAQANTRLWRRSIKEMLPGAQVDALSPSAGAINAARADFAAALPQLRDPIRRPSARTANSASVVLRVSFGEARIVLGADLETTGSNLVGWLPIVDNWDGDRAWLTKVAHHGSRNGDEPRVWSELLTERPVAVLTPYSPSRLPRPRDVQRILSNTDLGFATAPVGAKPPHRRGAVDRAADSVARDRRKTRTALGHVRVRFGARKIGNPQIDLFNGALHLKNLRTTEP